MSTEKTESSVSSDEVTASHDYGEDSPSHPFQQNRTVYEDPTFLVRKPFEKEIMEYFSKYKINPFSSKKNLSKTLTFRRTVTLKKYSGLRDLRFADEPHILRRNKAIVQIQRLQREYEKARENYFQRKLRKEPLKRQGHATPKAFQSVIREGLGSPPSLRESPSRSDRSPIYMFFQSKKRKELDNFNGSYNMVERTEADDYPQILDKKLAGMINDKAWNNHMPRSFSIIQRGTSFQRHASISGSANPKLRIILKKHSISKKPFELHSILKQLRTVQNTPMVLRIIYRVKKQTLNFFAKLNMKLRNLADPFEPHGIFMTLWNFILMIVVIYELIMVPVRGSFEVGFEDTFLVIEFIEIALYFIDILLNFHTIYYDDSSGIEDHKQIAIHYLKSWFFLDLLATIPFHAALQDVDHSDFTTFWAFLNIIKAMKAFRLFKFFKLRKQMTTIKEFFKLSMDLTISVEVNGIIRLLKLCILICFLAHWMACFWHLIGSNQGEESWIWKSNLHYAPWGDRYLAAVYWAATTMLTVGYGDISAGNSAERGYNIASMLLGCGIFAYTMNQIGDIINQINAEATYKEMKMDQLTKFLAKNEVDPVFQKKIKQYMEFKLDHERTLRDSDQAILDSISGSLKTELMRQINGKVLKNNVLFQRAFGSHFLLSLSMSLNEKVLAPDEFIYRENDAQDICIYFIIRGKIALYFERHDGAMKTLDKGDHLGELSFFSSIPREATARTLTFCSLFYISRERFLQLAGDHHTDGEMYHMVKDKVNLYQEYKSIGTTCLVCGSQSHLHLNCVLSHLIGHKEEVIRRYKWERKNFEETFFRKPGRRFNAFLDLKEIQLRAKQYVMTESLKGQTISFTDLGSLDPAARPRRKKRGTTVKGVVQGGSAGHSVENNFTRPESTSIDATYDDLTEMEHSGFVRLELPKIRSEAKEIKLPMKISPTLQALFTGDPGARRRFRRKILRFQTNESNNSLIFDEPVMDQIRNYQLYFPHNNLTKILEQMEYKNKHKKYYNMRLDSDHEIVQFKKKLGMIFEKTKRMSVSFGSNPGPGASPNQHQPQRKKSLFARAIENTKEALSPFRARTMV